MAAALSGAVMAAETRPALACAAVIAAALLALTPLTTLWDRDEPRFAQASVEMVATGQYLVPTVNGEWRVQKPPLVSWLMALSVHVFGASAFAVRVWSPIGMAVAGFATWALGRRLWSAPIGLMAMIVLALTPLTILEGVAATADAVLLAALTTAVACGGRMLDQGPRWRDAAAMGAALGVGLLTKGPVGLALPIAIVAITAWSVRRDRFAAVMWRLVAAVAIGLAIFAAWAVPAAALTDGLVVDRGLIRENLGRFMAPMDGHGTPLVLAPLYYPAVVLIGFLPWTFRLLPAARRLRSSETQPLACALVAAWIGVTLVAFSLAATKLPHYVLPCWPALALAVAAALGDDRATVRSLVRRATIAAAVIVAIAVAAAPVAESLKPVPAVAAAIRASTVDGPLHVFGFDEPSLVFYSGRRTIGIPTAAQLVTWAADPAPGLLVAPRDRVRQVEAEAGSLGLAVIASHEGWNVVNGERLELVAFVRGRER